MDQNKEWMAVVDQAERKAGMIYGETGK